MDSFYVKQPVKIIVYIVHEPTRTSIPVYDKIGFFQRIMIRMCFGLKYKKI
jgi:hypothetical protein|nr:MAG TPA: hypothetical protein [Caudoviricetes sp.]